MLEIHELQVFLTAAEAGSFSEAGRRLQMSQPAISMQIRALERRLDVELFHRAGRHIALTEIGQALVPMARDLVNRSLRVKEKIASLQGEIIGDLKIACSTTAGKYILPRLIAGYLERYPAVQVTCQLVSQEVAANTITDRNVHLLLTGLRKPTREVEYRQFISEPVILIAPADHRWAGRENIGVEELVEGRFIQREQSSGTQQTVIEALAEHDMSLTDLKQVMILGNSEAICLAVAAGIGVGFVSRCAALDAIRAGRLVEVPVRGLHMVQQLFMARPANNNLASAPAAFWEFIYAPDSLIMQGRNQQVSHIV
jgi:DNA-binding transcriptional LysR family regulator